MGGCLLKGQKYKSQKFCSFLTAVYFSLFFVNAVVGINGIGYLTILCVLAISYVAIKNGWMVVYRGWIIVLLFILCIYCLSFFRLGMKSYTIDYFAHFLAFGVIGIIIGMQRVKIRYVVKYVLGIGIIGMLVLLIRYLNMDGTASEAMGLGYSMLPFFLISCLGLQYGKIYRAASILLGSGVLFFYMKMGVRGIVVSIIIFALFILYYYLFIKKSKRKRVVISFIVLSGGAVTAIFLLRNIIDISKWMIAFCRDMFGIRVYALEKVVFYGTVKGDLLNGRGILWNSAWDAWKSHLFIGNGIGYFEGQNGTYVHNLFLQALSEAGLIFVIPLTIIAILYIGRLLFLYGNKMSTERYFYIAIVFVSGILPLFFSSCYWFMNPFWYALGYFMRQLKEND